MAVPEKWVQAIGHGARVRLRTAQNTTHAEGRIVAYSAEPQVLIVTDDGSRIWWRPDLTDVIDNEESRP